MYYTSGFLTLQLEIQNFFSTTSVGGAAIERNIMEETQKRFQSQMSFMDKLMNSSAPGANKTSPFDQFLTSVLSLQHKIYNKNAPVIDTPIFLRALSQPSYLQNKFWQQFGDIMTTCLVVYFCIPAVIVASRLSSEIKNGQIEILSTLPGVRIMHSAIAWCLCVVRILALWFGATLIFFYIVLESSDALIPAVNLLLLGLSLAPIAVTLTILVKQSDSVVVIIPTVVFVLMLPGLLYFDMAFDEQRTITTELLLCLSPPSAAAIVIRQLCSLESLGHGMKWTTLSPVANTPLFSYTYMLLFDIILYTIFMIAVSEIVAYSPIANRSAQAAGPIFEANELYLTGIGKEYGGLTGTVPVLTNICGRARIGTVTTLLGSNGAGEFLVAKFID